MSERNKLRRFADLDDLFDSNENETILQWVNQLAEKVETQRAQGKVYRKRQQHFAKVALEMLSKDEYMAVKKRAEKEALR